ncbi:serine/threonine-protein kinase [Streptomyces sp. DG2A-72]|uniref:serine/threonine-protein kinase n=1 Tax=Streptomyces sp. DG2A-72 TaxID=3051386 RepID=UPI00265B8B6F|nr:serine/threonine-protein kinase [Streptomyces sp. DG2A-72]MDO0934278.1 serine/threonine-protein kinase [Streptomyces sp. DG2A-72]
MAGSTEGAESLVGGRYRLSSRIGSGGHGTVWAAEDAVLGGSVTVRRIHWPTEPTEDDAERERALKVIRRLARQVDSPHILSVFDVLSDHDGLWVVMAHLPGARLLADVLRESGPLPPGRVARIGLDVLEALTAVHRAGLTQGHLTAERILIDREGRALFLGFDPAMPVLPDPARLTSSGEISASARYMAPELITGGRLTLATDLFSLAVVLYEAVEGRNPFSVEGDRSTLVVLHALMHEEPATPSRAGPLAPVLLRLLGKDPTQRPTADEVTEALRELAEPPDVWARAEAPGQMPGAPIAFGTLDLPPPPQMAYPPASSIGLTGGRKYSRLLMGVLIAIPVAALVSALVDVLPSLDGPWWLLGLWVPLVGAAVFNAVRRPVTSEAIPTATTTATGSGAAPRRGRALLAGATDAAVFLRPRTAVPPLPPTRDAYLHEAYNRLGPPPAAGTRAAGGGE